MTGPGQAESPRHKGYEMPPHSVEQAAGAVEIRRYAPHLVAEIAVEGGRGMAANRGFRALAGYIFGGNDRDARIAMTVPVAQEPQPDGSGWVIRFMMPAEHDLQSLPAPRDTRIRFVTDPGGRFAVLRFSGLPTAAALSAREETLRAWIARAGMEARGPAAFLFYDSPMTAPWARRNEVAIAVN